MSGDEMEVPESQEYRKVESYSEGGAVGTRQASNSSILFFAF
jgi:hypothetical protein